MDFVGELFISSILRDRIAKDIFQMLLEDKKRTDETIEAALRFINKIGKALEDKHKKTDKSKQKFTEDDYAEVVNIFKGITSEDNQVVAPRIKLLVKNMLENKESGWAKQPKENTKIKTKREVELNVRQKQQEAENQRSAPGQDDNRGGDRRRGDGRRDVKDRDDRNDKGGRGGRRNNDGKGRDSKY